MPGYTVAWVARNRIKDLSYLELCRRMEGLIKKAGILLEESTP
jgi:hypothetical protein